MVRKHRIPDRVQHFHIFRLQHAGRKRTCGAVAACRDHLEAALEHWPVGEIGDVTGRKVLDEPIRAAAAQIEVCPKHDVLETRHFVRTESERPAYAHLHPGPPVVIVRGRHHRDTRHIEIELGKIRHRGQGKPYIMDLASGRHQAGNQRVLDRRRVAAEIVAGDDLRPHVGLIDERAQSYAQRLHAHQVDLFLEQPSRVVFAEAGGLDHGLGFIGVCVGRQGRLRGGVHPDLKLMLLAPST